MDVSLGVVLFSIMMFLCVPFIARYSKKGALIWILGVLGLVVIGII